MKYLVGLSGGVDSSVAAYILKQQGHEVIGATMSIWGKDGMAVHSGHKNACYGPDEQEDIEAARKVAEQLDIPYYVFDCKNQYESVVLDNFKKEYLSGRTPNPCVWCNALIKFGVLPALARENGIDFDKFATGHYARIENLDGKYILKRGLAPKKDQSYFLYRLKQEQLANIYLPLGGYTKEEIRKIAKDNGLLAADKPDSQDFYAGDYNELLEITEKEGNIVNTEGKILGTHKGFWNYTIGQRKGLGVSSTEPLYVLELKKDTNEVVVGPVDKTFKKYLTADDLNVIVAGSFDFERRAQAKIRSTQQPVDVLVRPIENGKIEVEFDEYQKSIALGQSVVLYDEDLVLGGGVIDSAY
ncbi:MAG: tRNA 2-thiouridine(34) synthase MnmA [Candidatus Gastranaerophilaceae bacterium]